MANVLVDENSLQCIANAIREKNGTDDTYKPSEMPQAIRDIPTGGSDVYFTNDGRMYTEHLEFPETTTAIGENAYRYAKNLRSVSFTNNITSIRGNAFIGCTQLTQINLSDSITTISNFAFYDVVNVASTMNIKSTMTAVGSLPNGFSSGKLIFEEGLTNLPASEVFNYGGCKFSNEAYVYLPSSIISIGCYNSSNNSSGLKSTDDTCTLEVGDGFNASINASQFQQTAEKWVNVFEALADLTSQEPKILTIGSKNLKKLTDDQKAIATNKNWTLA